MPSIRQKITFGYYAFAVIIVLLSVFAYLDLDYLEQRIEVDEIISEFFDATLEMRRDEKNFFLYGEPVNYERVQTNAAHARALLVRHREVFLQYADTARLDVLMRDLDRFQSQFVTYHAVPEDDILARDELENEIRRIGRNISLEAGAMNQQERADVRASVSTARTTLVVSVILLSAAGIILGHILSRHVVRPLRMLEESMQPIAEGKFNKLDLPVKDREIVSFEMAFNRMLSAHDAHLQQLIQSEKLAALGTLVSGVAHELNNPLSNISSSAQILIEEGDAAEPVMRRELLQQIEDETDRARNTVRALLDFSRQGAFRREPVDLAGLVRQTVKFLKGHLPPEVKIAQAVPDGLTIDVDRRKIQQVILNLMKNALDAIGEVGTITVKAERMQADQMPEYGAVYVLGDKQCGTVGEMVLISVSDTGPGIPREILSRIFDPFFTTRDVGRGSGLGLYIVEEIVQQHQGCIGVLSEQDKGTTFLIKLPLQSGEVSEHTA